MEGTIEVGVKTRLKQLRDRSIGVVWWGIGEPTPQLAYSKSFRMLGTGSFPLSHTFLYCNIDIHQEYQQTYLLQLE